jgi:hypothetical protein
MPILRKRKIDGGFYIQALSFTTGGFGTYQVRPEGVAWLHEVGITTDETFPQSILRTLFDEQLVYIKSETVTGGFATTTSHSEPRAPSLPLRLEDREIWTLVLDLPEIPSQWFRNRDAHMLIAALSDSAFIVNGTGLVDAMRLWPGGGGGHYSLQPQPHPYTVQAVGFWPPDWDLSAWTCGARGIEHGITLFEDELRQGYRLTSGATLAPDRTYYCLLAPGQAALPPNTCPRYIQAIDQWSLWVIEIPSMPDKSLCAWCNEIGHPFEDSSWQLMSPLPPATYTRTGLPQFTRGIVLPIALVPPPEGSAFLPHALYVERNGKLQAVLPILVDQIPTEPAKPYYLSLTCDLVGTYCVRIRTSRTISFTFEIAEEAVQANSLWGPSPLVVSLAEQYWHVYQQGQGPHEVRLLQLKELCALQVLSPVPVDVIVRHEYKWLHYTRLAPQEVGQRLIEGLRESLRIGQQVQIYIDAGSAGFLALHLYLQDELIKRSNPLPVHLVQRARAVMYLLRTVPNGVVCVPIPPAVVATLASLQGVQGAQAILEIRYVPITILPHIIALSHAIAIHQSTSVVTIPTP